MNITKLKPVKPEGSRSQGQDGVYLDAKGNAKDITADTGLPGSFGDRSELGKQPVALPMNRVNRNSNLADDNGGDDYVLQFSVPEGLNPQTLTLARWDGVEKWDPVVSSDCLSELSYQSTYLNSLPNDVSSDCGAVVGLENGTAPKFWARLNQEGTFALVAR